MMMVVGVVGGGGVAVVAVAVAVAVAVVVAVVVVGGGGVPFNNHVLMCLFMMCRWSLIMLTSKTSTTCCVGSTGYSAALPLPQMEWCVSVVSVIVF
jgi:hypothetical protein